MRGPRSFIQLFVEFHVKWRSATEMLDMAYLNCRLYSIAPADETAESAEQQTARKALAADWLRRYDELRGMMRDTIQKRINDIC